MGSLADVEKACRIAAHIYTIGFTKAHNAQLLYDGFGRDIHHVSMNLEDLKKILEAAAKDGFGSNGRTIQPTLLPAIIGDFHTTLSECNKLLQNRTKFQRDRDNFITNLVFDLDVANRMKGLKDRVAFLNLKLLTILQTLNVHSAQQLQVNLARVHRDLAYRIDNARDDILDAIAASQGGSLASIARSQKQFEAPEYLIDPFTDTCEVSRLDDGHFPLLKGLDAAAFHIQCASNIIDDEVGLTKERQWLALCKCSWILKRIQDGNEYKDACSVRPSTGLDLQLQQYGITVKNYVRALQTEMVELAKELSLETYEPDALVILDIYHGFPQMWQESLIEEASLPWDFEFKEKLMSGQLDSPFANYEQHLHLYQQTETNMKLVITNTPRAERQSTNTTNNIIDLNLAQARFIPLYATPGSGPGVLNVNFQTDRHTQSNTALSFQRRSDLIAFQQAITGYKVVFDAMDINVTTYLASRFIGGGTTEYSGRAQLWHPKRLTSIQDTMQCDKSDIESNSLSRHSSYGRQDSVSTTNSAASRAQTLVEGSSSIFHQSPVDKKGSVGLAIEVPEDPVLMLYLQETKPRYGCNPKKLLLKIQMNKKTQIDRQACRCRVSDPNCVRSVIQQSRGNGLVARQLNTDLDQWNLAILGQFQKPSAPPLVQRLAWIAIDFRCPDDREKFGRDFCDLQMIAKRRMTDYIADLENLKT